MEYDWIEMMNHMQNLRRFCSFHTRRAKSGRISSAQELDMLSRIALSKTPLTPHTLTVSMGLQKSAVSRLIEHLEQKQLLTKEHSPTDGRSYFLVITEKGERELNQTYQYYLGPIYSMRRKIGEERFLKLMELIKETNDMLQNEED